MALRKVEPVDAYDESKFVGAVEDVLKLGNLEQGLKQSPDHPRLRQNLGSLLRDDDSHFGGMQTDLVFQELQTSRAESSGKLAGYTARNWSTLFDLLQEQDILYGILASPGIPLTDKKHGNSRVDDLLKAVSEYREIRQAESEGNIRGYLDERVERDQDWRDESYAYGKNNDQYVSVAFNAYLTQASRDVKNAATAEKPDSEGKKVLDKALLRDTLTFAYENAGSDNEKSAYQLAVAQNAYKSLKSKK
jgi:hypothetical protein